MSSQEPEPEGYQEALADCTILAAKLLRKALDAGEKNSRQES